MLLDYFIFRPKISPEILNNMQSGLLSNNLICMEILMFHKQIYYKYLVFTTQVFSSMFTKVM